MIRLWVTGKWWRPVVHAPACVTGAALIGGSAWWWANKWGAVVAIALWVGSSSVMLSRRGERFLMGMFGWSPIALAETFSPDVTARLEQLVGDLGVYDFYEAPAESPNALAVGGHTVGVTSMLIRLYRQALVDDGHVVAVLLHEIGHHRGQSLRYTAVVTYLMQPWYWVRLMLGGFVTVFREMARANPFGVVLVAAFATAPVTVAVLAWLAYPFATSAALVGLVAVFVVMPWLDGVLSRAEELSADKYAQSMGYGVPLVEFLTWVDDNTTRPAQGWFARATSLHPPVLERVGALNAGVGS